MMRLMKVQARRRIASYSTFFTESMAESVYTDAKVLDWKLPHKIEDVYTATMGTKWQIVHEQIVEANYANSLPRGNSPLQLYSLATPNGQKVGIMLEELGVEYDAHVVDILHGRQHAADFVKINPNAKIPAMIDSSNEENEIKLFESGSILLYLAQKYGRYIPTSHNQRAECINWVFWQSSGFGPVAGQLWHFLQYAPTNKPEAKDYGIARYGMETQRLCGILDKHLASRPHIIGEEYTIADMMMLPWIHLLNNRVKHSSGIVISDFLSMDKYQHIRRWESQLLDRENVQRGLQVCSFTGVPKPWVKRSNKSPVATPTASNRG